MSKEIQINGNLVENVELAGKSSKDFKKIENYVVDRIKHHRQLWRKEIDEWHMARYAWYQTTQPRSYLMQELYSDIMLDGHLTGITGNRTLRVINKPFCLAVDGVKDEDLTKYIEDKEWFQDLLQSAHESIYRGYSLIWLEQFENGEIKKVRNIDRRYVLAQQDLLLKSIDGINGLRYLELPEHLLYCQLYDQVGLLEKAAPYTILKRHSWSSWDEFEELFGVPIRIAKIASQSERVKDEVSGWMHDMGQSAYAVLPVGTDVEIKENSKTDSFRVFMEKIQQLDKEMSKLVLHQTMTTDSGSSRSQGEVHQTTLEELIYADERKMLSFLNTKLLPAMRYHGYVMPEGAHFMIEKTTNVNRQIEIDEMLMRSGYVLKQDYLERTYGVEIERLPGENEPPGKP